MQNCNARLCCLLVLAAIPAIAGCGERQVEAGVTPDQTIEALNTALSESDWESLYDLAPPSERRITERLLAERSGMEGKDCREVFAEVMQKRGLGTRVPSCSSGCSFKRAEIEGVRCLATCEGEGCERRLVLSRERCGWYVSGLLSPLRPVASGK